MLDTIEEMDAIKEIDYLVDKYVENYKTDWYAYDRPRAVNSGEALGCIVAIRRTGVDTLFFAGPEVSWQNVTWFQSAQGQKRAGAYFCIVDGECHLTSERAANMVVEKVLKTFPEDYVNVFPATKKWQAIIEIPQDHS